LTTAWLADLTASRSAVWASQTLTTSFAHCNRLGHFAHRTGQQRWMIFVTESNEDKPEISADRTESIVPETHLKGSFFRLCECELRGRVA